MNKKIKTVLIGVVVLLIIFICFFLYSFNSEKIIIKGQKLNDSYIELFNISGNQKIYSQFTEIEYVDKDNNKYELIDALKNNKITIDYIISKSEKIDELNDGGTKIYYFNNRLFNKKIEIVKCNTLDGVKDIFIIEKFDYTDSVCDYNKKQ